MCAQLNINIFGYLRMIIVIIIPQFRRSIARLFAEALCAQADARCVCVWKVFAFDGARLFAFVLHNCKHLIRCYLCV